MNAYFRRSASDLRRRLYRVGQLGVTGLVKRRDNDSRIELSCRIAYVIELLMSFAIGIFRPGDFMSRNIVAGTMIGTFAVFVYVRRRWRN
jgi:hypothetical protein